jgi:hypothetical protein
VDMQSSRLACSSATAPSSASLRLRYRVLLPRDDTKASACSLAPLSLVEGTAASQSAMALPVAVGSRGGRCSRSPLPLARIFHCLTVLRFAPLFVAIPCMLSLLALSELPVITCLLYRCRVLIPVPFLEFFFFQKNCALSQFFGHLCRRESPKGRNFKRVCQACFECP